MHHHWCEIRGHWWECDKPCDLDGTQESDGAIELRDDCPQCAGFHWWKIPRWLGYFWRYWVCTRMTMPYWRWRASRLRCEQCGKRLEDRTEILICAMSHRVGGYVCRACEHVPTAECGTNCELCKKFGYCKCGCASEPKENVGASCAWCRHVYRLSTLEPQTRWSYSGENEDLHFAEFCSGAPEKFRQNVLRRLSQNSDR